MHKYLIGIGDSFTSGQGSVSRKFHEKWGDKVYHHDTRIPSIDIEESENQFIPSEKLLKYEFVTPWVALNHMTGGKYRFLGNQEKPSFLNKLIGQNIIFLSNTPQNSQDFSRE